MQFSQLQFDWNPFVTFSRHFSNSVFEDKSWYRTTCTYIHEGIYKILENWKKNWKTDWEMTKIIIIIKLLLYYYIIKCTIVLNIS